MNFGLLFNLTLKSILNRKFTAMLTILSICFSVFLLMGVEKVRTEAKNSFTSTVSGTDVIVGARSGSVQLLLYSIFRIGNATNNISWSSYQEISSHPSVSWSVPISLGDSHRGFRVMGTNEDYFKFYRYGNDYALDFMQGQRFEQVYDAVLGADVATDLGYQIGDKITLSHGLVDTHFSKHDDKPFKVSGILDKTGTPVDRTIHVSLQGIEALHIDWQGGMQSRKKISAEDALEMDLAPKQITAFMLGLESKMTVFRLQRAINKYKKEPLLAILPGIALGELWQLMSVAEKALLAVTLFVVINSFIGLLTVLLTSLNERRREVAILRSLGCRPAQVFILLALESFILVVLGCVLGLCLFYLAIALAQPLLQTSFGIYVPLSFLSSSEQAVLGLILLVSLLVGSVPGYRAYKYSLADGMSVKV